MIGFKQVALPAVARSSAICPTCGGTGRVSQRVRHYGERGYNHSTCPDCYDAAEAQRAEDESFARHCAAIRESDDLMGAYRRAER